MSKHRAIWKKNAVFANLVGPSTFMIDSFDSILLLCDCYTYYKAETPWVSVQYRKEI